jgi:hypothetical protein
MWISLEAVSKNVIETGSRRFSGSLFIREVISPSSDFCDPEKYFGFLHCFLSVNIAEVSRDFLWVDALFDQKSNHMSLFQQTAK